MWSCSYYDASVLMCSQVFPKICANVQGSTESEPMPEFYYSVLGSQNSIVSWHACGESAMGGSHSHLRSIKGTTKVKAHGVVVSKNSVRKECRQRNGTDHLLLCSSKLVAQRSCVPHPSKCSRPGCMGLWAAWSRGWQPCPRQWGWNG